LTSSYDPFGKLANVAASGAVTNVTRAFGWSPTTGLLSTLTMTTPAWSSTLARGYDGSLLTDQTWSGAVAGSYHRQFDNNFAVASDTVAGSTASYLYDKDNLLTSAGGETLVRDPGNGLLAGTTLGTIADVIHYDEFGAVHDYTANAGTTGLYAVDYGQRDALGRITTKKETIGGVTSTYGYDYDARGQLWHTYVNGTLTATYLYDANGNRLSHDGVNTSDGTYDAQDRMLTYLGATYSYGPNGELQTKTLNGQTITYRYDAFGNLSEVDLPGKIVTYVSDGQQRRIGKLVNGVLVKAWLYRDQLSPIAELDGSGNLVSRFVYGSSKRVPDAILRGGTAYRVIRDQLESPRLIVDSTTGQVVERIDYDVWGNVTQDSAASAQPPQPFQFASPFGFAGGLYDSDTGLVRFGARDYDPLSGRWTAKDPIRLEGGDTNFYRYSGNDPVDITDPAGLAWGCDTFAWLPWCGGGEGQSGGGDGGADSDAGALGVVTGENDNNRDRNGADYCTYMGADDVGPDKTGNMVTICSYKCPGVSELVKKKTIFGKDYCENLDFWPRANPCHPPIHLPTHWPKMAPPIIPPIVPVPILVVP
jgi:RHS repeat-associated protein